jgi:hypothetical protein
MVCVRTMGGAVPVKNSLWFELSVAARFNSSTTRIGNWELDITDCFFDPNHRPYPTTLTSAGYPAEIDITATGSSTQHNISCKFTKKSGQVLRSLSKEFLETMLEFMPLGYIEQSLPFQMNYILAINFGVEEKLREMPSWKSEDYSMLSQRVMQLGLSRHRSTFNETLFEPDELKRLLAHLQIFSFNIEELQSLHKKDESFKQAFDTISRRLLNAPKQGISLYEIIRPDFTLFCKSPRHHKRCYEMIMGGKFCHIGDMTKIQKELQKRLRTQSSRLIGKISGSTIGIERACIQSDKPTAPETICRMLCQVLNDKRLMKADRAYTYYVTPIEFDIIAFDAFKLAKKIQATEDGIKKLHPLNVNEIRGLGLGTRAIEDLTILAFQNGFGYKLPTTDIVCDIESN